MNTSYLINEINSTRNVKYYFFVLRFVTQTHTDEENLKKETTFPWKKTVDIKLIVLYKHYFVLGSMHLRENINIIGTNKQKMSVFETTCYIVNN